MKFALIRNNLVQEYRHYTTTPESRVVEGLPVLRPVVDLPQPAFDPDLHRLEEVVQIFDDRVEVGWTPVPADLADLKRLKIVKIELAAEAALAPIISAYPLAERDTWPIQEAEAIAWTADPLAPTPMLDEIAAARGQAIADVVVNVLTKASAFKVLAGATFGKRKAKIDLVTAATTAEDVAAIAW